MKLVFYCAFGYGATRLLLPKARHARDLGWDVSFIFSPGEDVAKIEAEGFAVHPVYVAKAIRPLRDARAIWASKRILRKLNPDIVSTHFAKGGAIGRVAATLANVPFVVHTPHGFPFIEGQKNRIKFWLYAGIESLLANFTNVLLTQTEDDAQLAVKLKIRPKNETVVIGNGINLDDFDPDKVIRGTPFWQNYTDEEKPTILTTFSRINDVKGIRDLIEALGQVSDLNWQFFHFGPVEDEKLFAWMRSRLQELELTNRYHYLGVTEQAKEILKETDWFVLPSIIEGMPRSLIEGHALGVPAIASNIRGSKSVVAHGKTGFLVPPHAPYELAQTLRLALNLAPDVKGQMNQAAMNRARALFDEDDVKTRLARVYQCALQEKKSVPARGSPSRI